eukprot:TRINITY_DN16753_c0_g1_i1.p1 TRINITY_DN16753_c0_g1~~TRINITY_DN16753_c0_g1_i1.p1  ORF type:complete len:878 (+),score=186.50 TRINITY_DN16753_c0_g1_i1:74-2707(+)
MAESSDSSSDEEEQPQESLDDKIKRVTQLGKAGDVEALLKEANLLDTSPSMIAFASQKSREMGNAAFQKKNYEEALEFYAGALMGDCPEKHKVYSNRSACFFQLGKYTDALLEATKAIKEDRSWSKGYFRAGRAALEMEYYDEALEMFEKGLDKEPSNQDLVVWSKKARDICNQQRQDKLIKKHTNDYSKFDNVLQQLTEEEQELEALNDPNRIILGDKYYTSSKMEQRQLKAMLGYKEEPPAPFEPTFDTDLVYRHDARGAKTQHPVWDATAREWRMNAKPAPSRIDYSDSVQAQAIALFLERQSDVQYAEELLHLLDQNASPVTAYVSAMRDLVGQLVDSSNCQAGGSSSSSAQPGGTGTGRRKHAGRTIVADDARWLFVGIGSGLSVLTVNRYLPTAELVVNTAHRAAYIADLSMTLLAQNGVKRDRVRFVHRPSNELAVSDPDGKETNNLIGKADIAVFDYEMMDPGLIGKGLLTKISHAKRKVLASEHRIVPTAATVACVGCEILCPRSSGPDAFNWKSVDECRWGAFYETTNLDRSSATEPWRPLGAALDAFSFDFSEAEVKLSGQTDLMFTASEDGVLNCIAFWYRASLTENVQLDHTPQMLHAKADGAGVGDYCRHALQWLPTPVPVRKGDQVVLRASYSRARIRFEVTQPELPAKAKQYACPRWMFPRLWDEERLKAYQKAIQQAVERLVAARAELPALERPALRIVHQGAGLGQLSMVAASCLRDSGEKDIDGYSVVALEPMPKIAKLTQRVLKDNGLQRDVFWCSEDVRKLPSQPHRAQLIVSELLDPGLLGEGILPLLGAARIKMCSALEHEVIPSRATIWAAAFEAGHNLNDVHGFSMSALNQYRAGGSLMVDVDTLLELQAGA